MPHSEARLSYINNYHTVTLFLSSLLLVATTTYSFLSIDKDMLTDAALLGCILQELQDQMASMRAEIQSHKGASTPTISLAQGDTQTEPPTYLPTQWIAGMTWAEEMDVVHPLDDDDDVSQTDVTCPEGAHVTEETGYPEANRSFVSLKNLHAQNCTWNACSYISKY